MIFGNNFKVVDVVLLLRPVVAKLCRDGRVFVDADVEEDGRDAELCRLDLFERHHGVDVGGNGEHH